MRIALLSLATAGLLILPTAVRGEDPKPRGRPDPEVMFNHLDKNHDGVITAEEIPDNAPPPLKALLKPGDKKGITKDQFMAAVKERRDAKRHAGPGPVAGPGVPGPRDRKASGPPQGAPRPGITDGPKAEHRRGPGLPDGPQAEHRRGPGMPDGPQAEHRRGPGMAGGPGPGMGVPQGERKPFDVKALFAMFDKDKDGKLSLDEFAEGMKRMHDRMTARFHGAPPVVPPMAARKFEGDRRDMGRPEGPGPMARRDLREGPPPAMRHGPGCPCFERCPMMPRERHGDGYRGDDRGPRGPRPGEAAVRGEFRGEFHGEFRGEMEHPRMRPPRGDVTPEARRPAGEHRKAVDGPKDGPRPEVRAGRPADPLKAIEAKLQEMDAKLRAIERRLPK